MTSNAFSRRSYELMAEAIGREYSYAEPASYANAMELAIKVFKADNPRFDESKFRRFANIVRVGKWGNAE